MGQDFPLDISEKQDQEILEGQLQAFKIKPYSSFGKKLKNLSIKINSIFISSNNKTEDYELKTKMEKVHSFTVDDKVYRLSTNQLLKLLYFDKVGAQTTAEIFKEELIQQIDEGNTTEIETQIKERLQTIQNETQKKEVVREAVFEKIPNDTITNCKNRIYNVSSKPINSTGREEQYIQALGSGSTTCNSNTEGSQATKNLKNANGLIEKAAQSKEPIGLDLIRSLNRELTQNTENNGGNPGELRESGVISLCGEGTYLLGAFVEPEMQALCDMVNKGLEDANGDPEKVVETAARALSWFTSIHPFKDGNGRTGRLLVNLILIKGGLPPAILDGEKGKSARFGESLLAMKEPELTETEREECEQRSGTKIQVVYENIIAGIEEMVQNFGSE